jgi:plastocyanin
VLLATAAPASPHAGHAPIQVDIANQSFAPRDVQIYQGDSIIFTWKGPDTNHSATGDNFDSDAGKQPAAVFHPIGDTYAVTFNDVGTFNYHCKVHPSMTGTVAVQAVPGPPTPVAPKLTKVSAKPAAFTRRTTLHFTLDTPASVRAILRRGTKTLKEVDFLAHPGQNTHKVNFGSRLKPGKATLRVVAVDQTSGLASKTASLKVQIRAVATSSSFDYPPITCGRVTFKSKRYVVKAHGPSCTTAIRGVKGYLANHTSPRYYKCKSYGGDIPAYCTGAVEKYRKRYFFASKG